MDKHAVDGLFDTMQNADPQKCCPTSPAAMGQSSARGLEPILLASADNALVAIEDDCTRSAERLPICFGPTIDRIRPLTIVEDEPFPKATMGKGSSAACRTAAEGWTNT